MACAEDPSGEYAAGLLQHSRVTTLFEGLIADSSSVAQNGSTQRGIGNRDALLTVAAHAAGQMTEMSSLNYSAFSEFGFIGLLCVLISLLVIVVCMTAFTLAKQNTSSALEEKPPTYTHVSSSSSLDLSTSRDPILVADDDGLLLKVCKSVQSTTPLTPGVDVIDAGPGLHLLHFMPGPPDSSSVYKGACCTLRVGAGGPLLASVEVGAGAAVFRDSRGKTIGGLEAAGHKGYVLNGLGSCKAFLRGVFSDRSLTLAVNGGLVASTEVRPGVPDRTRPTEPEVLVCIAPRVDAGLVLCAVIAADWLEAAMQGHTPQAPWGCAFPLYFRHRLNLVVDEQS